MKCHGHQCPVVGDIEDLLAILSPERITTALGGDLPASFRIRYRRDIGFAPARGVGRERHPFLIGRESALPLMSGAAYEYARCCSLSNGQHPDVAIFFEQDGSPIAAPV